MSLTSKLYKAARLSATAKAVSSGDPDKMARRGKNILVGRMFARGGIWRWLWK